MSTEAASEIPDNISLLFVDGMHTLQAVTEDINNYWDKIVPNGFAIFHDYKHPEHPGVMRAVEMEIMRHEERKKQVMGYWYCGISAFIQKGW